MPDLVIRKPQELRQQLELHGNKLFAALPNNLSRERFMAICIRAFAKTPKLADCSALSILDSISQAATLGLEPDGVLGFAYLVPYKQTCVLIPGYKGLLQLVRNSGKVSTIQMEAVYKGDKFDFTKGLKPTLVHVPKASSQDDDKITHIYVVFTFTDGGVQFDVWPRARLEEHKRKYVRANKASDPWSTNFREMAGKTVVRYMIARGLLPLSSEVVRLASQEELVESEIESHEEPEEWPLVTPDVVQDHPDGSINDPLSDLGELLKSCDTPEQVTELHKTIKRHCNEDQKATLDLECSIRSEQLLKGQEDAKAKSCG